MTCPNVQLGPVLVEGWCRKSSPSLSMYGVRGSGETVEITADGVRSSPPLAAFRTLTAPIPTLNPFLYSIHSRF